jgi:predicted kinase
LLDVLRFYVVHLALVRAKVRALKRAQNAAEAGRADIGPYLETARAFVAPRTPRLVITHGLSGSGKTHVTQTLIGAMGAVRVRSDLERKRLHGLDAGGRSGSAVGGGIYDARANELTYGRLAEAGAAALRNGFDAIVDATFLRRAERAAFARLAKRHGARLAILDCVAPEDVLRRRITSRAAAARDASEANLAVLDNQLAEQDRLSAEEEAATVRVPTDAELDLRAVLAALNRR